MRQDDDSFVDLWHASWVTMNGTVLCRRGAVPFCCWRSAPGLGFGEEVLWSGAQFAAERSLLGFGRLSTTLDDP